MSDDSLVITLFLFIQHSLTRIPVFSFGGMGAGKKDEVTGSISALGPWKRYHL